MGTSIFLVFIIPLMVIYGVFGNFFTAIFGEPQTEIILPYNEAEGIVWEYDNKEDYYIELAETKVEGDKQIFVFQHCEVENDDGIVGELMDLVFTDKNGNQKKYYSERSDGFMSGPRIYEESECIVTEYTAVAKNPDSSLHWDIMQENDSILIQPKSYDAEVTFTVVHTPEDAEFSAMYNWTFTPIFSYETEDGGYHETIAVKYEIVDGKLVEKK